MSPTMRRAPAPAAIRMYLNVSDSQTLSSIKCENIYNQEEMRMHSGLLMRKKLVALTNCLGLAHDVGLALWCSRGSSHITTQKCSAKVFLLGGLNLAP